MDSLTVDVTENRHVDLLKPDENPCLAFQEASNLNFCLSSSANFLGHSQHWSQENSSYPSC